MTTTQKIIFTPAAQQDKTASASQDREQMQGIEQTLDRMGFPQTKPADAQASGAHTPMTGDTERLLQIGQLTRERDQAREQVKTLLAIVSEVYMRLPIGSRDNEDLYGRCRAAIASMESEGR